MKTIQFFLLMLFFGFSVYAQRLEGTVKNESGEVLPGALVKAEGTNVSTVTDNDGKFLFQNLSEGEYMITISMIGYEDLSENVVLTNKLKRKEFVLKTTDIMADEVIVTALRADANTPVAYVDLDEEVIKKYNTGQDIPYILEMTPSMVVTSDAGNGIGYTSMRIRGTDMTRINVTLDGIPLNDAESHGVFWVNMPDFASSVDNIQIQRGVGTSTNGAAAFGANVNFVTNMLEKEAFGRVNISGGSFNTRKITVKTGTGLINDHFVFDLRLSKIHSDGFVDRARTDLESFYVSGAYADKKNFFKVNVFRGHEETYQSWYGIPKDSLETNRTYNPYTYENEIDHYTQDHFQVFYTRTFQKSLDLNLAFHYTQGSGYYEQFKEEEAFADYNLNNVIFGNDTVTNTDLIRRKWLDNDFYGAVYSLNFHRDNLNVVFGGALNNYTGDHFGRVIWSRFASNGDIRHEWYNNTGIKLDLNQYVKINYQFAKKLNLWADLQYRTIKYSIDGIHDDLRDITQTHTYTFFNPKAGFLFLIDQSQRAYFSFALANREPNRSNFRDADNDEDFTHETLYDYEAGYKLMLEKLAFTMNLYYMDYKNQLILTGEINDVGAYIMSNVPNSYRAGIELSAGTQLTDFLTWNVNASFSRNKIYSLTVFVDNWDTWGQEEEYYEETDISFSPNIVTGSEINFELPIGFNASFMSKYVGKQFIDNTASDERSLDPYFVNNLRLNYTMHTKKIKEIGFNVSINNVFNEEYETNAWVYRFYSGGEQYTTDGYFPQAGINFMLGLDLKF